MIDLLRRSLHRCNRAGTTIGVLTGVVGTFLIALQLCAPGYVLQRMTPVLPELLGQEEATRFSEKLATARIGTNDHLMLAGETALAVQAAVERLPLEKQEAMFEKAGERLGPFFRTALLVAAVVFALEIITRIVALVAVSRPEEGNVFLRSVRSAPKILGVWLLLAGITGLWIALLALAASFILPPIFALLSVFVFALPLLLYPRFALAPAILLSERTGMLDAIRLSYRRTKNRYAFVLLGLVTAQVAVLLADRIGNLVVGSVVAVASTRSPYAPIIGLTLTVAHVVFVAYRAGFVVELNERFKT